MVRWVFLLKKVQLNPPPPPPHRRLHCVVVFVGYLFAESQIMDRSPMLLLVLYANTMNASAACNFGFPGWIGSNVIIFQRFGKHCSCHIQGEDGNCSVRRNVTVAVTKLHASRSQQNRTALQHKQRSQGEWRQLRTSSRATLDWCLRPPRKGGGVLPWPWSMKFGDGYDRKLSTFDAVHTRKSKLH
jgi:hypothetical protein